jgi:hypothetical protein
MLKGLAQKLSHTPPVAEAAGFGVGVAVGSGEAVDTASGLTLGRGLADGVKVGLGQFSMAGSAHDVTG